MSPRSNRKVSTWSAVNFKKHLTSMSCQLEPAIWSRDTGQGIPCFDRCQLIITWMSNTKEVHSKPRLHVSVNLLFGVWQPSCASRNFFWDHFSTELCNRTQMWRSRPGFHFTENGGEYDSERRGVICLSRSTFCRGKANE